MRHHDWKIQGRLSPLRRPAILTWTEMSALREAWRTGRFTKRSLGRIYDISGVTVANALKDTYKPRMDY
jgi:hypothetical protein